MIDNEYAICYSACDIDPLITEPMQQTNLWQHLKENLSWNTYYKDKIVKQEIKRIKNHGSWYFNYLSKQASPYIHYVTIELEKRGLPLELALLPYIESNYDAYAFSHGSAAGFWQMIPSTARQYGVAINSWYDGRRDIVFSTQAALDYLTYLHKRFDGDWLLAIAAYNAGEGTVSYVQRRNAAWGKGTDFWSLSLPRAAFRLWT
jgi:membrane-bound lytic murein transglycosylase D